MHRDYLLGGPPLCDAESPDGAYECTRSVGHAMPHEAAGDDDLCAEWDDDRSTDS